MLRFGTDGVRGVANVDLTPELVLALGRAAARVLGGWRFVVARDTRRSGPLLEAALEAAEKRADELEARVNLMNLSGALDGKSVDARKAEQERQDYHRQHVALCDRGHRIGRQQTHNDVRALHV